MILKLPFKYYLSRIDEMARPPLKVKDEAGEREYEPIANVPYFMGKTDIMYLYQFPPSLWPEAFHYRINIVLREFIEFLQSVEEAKVKGVEPKKWNDIRSVELKWKGTKERTPSGVRTNNTFTIKYRFPKIKMFVEEYWDAIQRDIDTEFFATREDSPDARQEYEQILIKAIANNADAGGYFGSSLRKYTGVCKVQQTQKIVRDGETKVKEDNFDLWACAGYNPVTYQTISTEIANWLSSSHVGWGLSKTDPLQRNVTISNKGKEHFKISAIQGEKRLKSIANRLKNAGGTPFTVHPSGQFVNWPNVEKLGEIKDENGKLVGKVNLNINYTSSIHGKGINGVDKHGLLPFVRPGYKIESKPFSTVRRLTDLTDFSEISSSREQKLIHTLLGDEEKEFSAKVENILKVDVRAKERLEQQVKNITSIRKILSIINSDISLQKRLTELSESLVDFKGGKKEKLEIEQEISLLNLIIQFKNWVDGNYVKAKTLNLDYLNGLRLALLDKIKSHDKDHYDKEYRYTKDGNPTEDQEKEISLGVNKREKLVGDFDELNSLIQFKTYMDLTGKITATNFIPLLYVYLRQIQVHSKKYDIFSYAIHTHNNQRKSRNPLGLDMENPLLLGDKKYPSLRDKAVGIGTFDPNRNSKNRLHATAEQWNKLQGFFGHDAKDFPFSSKQIESLIHAGNKYLSKMFEYLANNEELLNYLGIDPNDARALINLSEFNRVLNKAKKEKLEDVPHELRVFLKELKQTEEKIDLLESIKGGDSIQSAILDGIDYLLRLRGGDQFSVAAKYDPSLAPSISMFKKEVAKAAEQYLMRTSASGPLLYFLNTYNNPNVPLEQKIKIYFEARREVEEIAKNYVITLVQLPMEGRGTALEFSRRKRGEWGQVAGVKQVSQMGTNSDGEQDFNVLDQISKSGISMKDVLTGPVVSIISSSIFNDKDPENELKSTLKRMEYRKFRPASGTLGPEVQGGTVVGQDIEVFAQFLTDQIKLTQKDKKEREALLTKMDMNQTTDNELLSKLGVGALLYRLMELEVEVLYADDLGKERNQQDRETRKRLLATKMMKDWVSKNTNNVSQESLEGAESPDLNDSSNIIKLQRSLNAITKDMKEFDKSNVNISLIPKEIRTPEVINALEITSLIIRDLEQSSGEEEYEVDDLDKEISNLDTSPSSPWANDPNKHYKVNIALVSTGAGIKYKQAARVTETLKDPELSSGQIDWIKSRTNLLKDKIRSRQEKATSLPQATSAEPKATSLPQAASAEPKATNLPQAAKSNPLTQFLNRKKPTSLDDF